MSRWRGHLVVLLVAACLSAACAAAPSSASSSPPPVSTPAPAGAPTPAAVPTPAVSRSVVIIEAADQYFNPAQVSASLGTTVVWNDVQGTHDMVADDKSFASSVLFEGASYSHLFNTPGHYRYICTLHVGAGMWAEVDIQ